MERPGRPMCPSGRPGRPKTLRKVSFRNARKAQKPWRVPFKKAWKVQTLRKVSYRQAWNAKTLGGCRLEVPNGLFWYHLDNGSKSRCMLQIVSCRTVLDDVGLRQPRCSKRSIVDIVLNSFGPLRRSKLQFRCRLGLFRVPFGITSKVDQSSSNPSKPNQIQSILPHLP